TPLGRRAVVGEPTNLRPIRKHKGILMESFRVDGRSGHSSNPALGRSALEGMHRVISEVLAYRAEVQAANHDDSFEVTTPTLNLGRIAGGDAPNRICASCELAYDFRALPGMNAGEERAKLHERVRNALRGSGLDVSFSSLAQMVDPFETAADAELVRTLEALTGQLSGAVAFATEGPFYNALGMETVVMGPGSIDVAHQPNEFLPLDSIEPTLDLLSQLITRYCVQPNG
ncbi:MAG: M20/M25/M40 family metallo-hydrolase, partial [Myxococcales bacterium]|nr:M20/M25/M40 family metallo-hydrolase [Myxococcales bacterium]